MPHKAGPYGEAQGQVGGRSGKEMRRSLCCGFLRKDKAGGDQV